VDPVKIADGDAGPSFQAADLVRPSNAMHEILSSRQQAGLPLYQKNPAFNTHAERANTPLSALN